MLKLNSFLLIRVVENLIKKIKDKELRNLLKILLIVILLGIFIGVVSAITYNLMSIKGNVSVKFFDT